MSPPVSVLLLAALCFTPACTPLLVDTGGFDLYSSGDSRQTAEDRDGDTPAKGRRDTLFNDASARGGGRSAAAGKKRSERDLYTARTGKKDVAAPRASRRGDSYDHRGRGSGRGDTGGRKAVRGSEPYRGAAASRDRYTDVAEKGPEAGGAFYEAGPQAKEPGREEPDQDRISSQEKEERDLYRVMQTEPRLATREKPGKPRAEKGADLPSGQPDEGQAEIIAKAAPPPPSGEKAAGKAVGETIISPSQTEESGPPAPAVKQEPARKPAAEKAVEKKSVSPPPTAAIAPPPAPSRQEPVRKPAAEKAVEEKSISPPPAAISGLPSPPPTAAIAPPPAPSRQEPVRKPAAGKDVVETFISPSQTEEKGPPSPPPAAAAREKKSAIGAPARKAGEAADIERGEDLYDRRGGGSDRGANGRKAERGLDLYDHYPDADGRRMSARDTEDDLYSGSQTEPRRETREKAAKPQAEKDAERPSDQPAVGGKKSAPTETALRGGPERELPSVQRRPTPPAVAAAPEQMARMYPEQRREAEDLIEAGTRERPPGRGLLVVNRPPNIQGLTGLLFTNSAYTLPTGKFSVGASLLSEYSKRPEFSVLQIPVTLTYGLTDRVELGVKAKIVDLDSPIYPERAQGFGDSEISAKWRFSSRRFILPEMAVGLSYIAPTGNENKHLNEVVNWGMKLIGIASLEGRTAGGRVLGIYAEAQAVFIDELAKGGSSTPGAERYGVINGGVLVPVTADNRTQLLVEYSQIVYKSKLQPTMIEGNQNAGTAAVRYVTESFSTTAGVQYINKEQAGDQNTYRFVWKLSLTL